MRAVDTVSAAGSEASATTSGDLWARHRLDALTAIDEAGRAPLVPAALPGSVERLTRRISNASRAVGRPVDIDGFALLRQRAVALAGEHAGRPPFGRSFGGRARLVRAGDGWLAISVARTDDIAALPAWLETDVAEDHWLTIESELRDRSVDEMVERAGWLDLPCGRVGEIERPVAMPSVENGDRPWPRSLEGALVVNLASLWAGPLCAQLLRRAGARVVDVESVRRPDGARLGPKRFYRDLHAGHEQMSFDFHAVDGAARLRELIESADVVIEGSRPRALEQLGIDAVAVAASGVLWVSITAYGRAPELAHRVGFGDDAAAAGGLVGWSSDAPCFLADAIADPLTGMTAAAGVLSAFAEGERGRVLDIPLASVAAAAAGSNGDDAVRAS